MASMTDRNRVGKIMNAILNGGSASLDAWPTALHIRLLTANGSNTSNGTEATGVNCPGYTAGGTAITFGASSSGVSASSNAPSWTSSGSWSTVTGCEVWDTAGTPLRWLQGALSASITGVGSGDTVQFATGAVTADASAW
jgi:hypothetical protein